MMVHIKEVAKLANTSITTVSRVINDTGYVKEETRNRVLKAIDQLGYQPLERSNQKKETKAIGLVIPNIENPFFGKVAKHLTKVANQYNYNILLYDIQASDVLREEFLMDLIEKRVDGLIYASSKRFTEAIEKAQEKNKPIVIFDREVKNGEISAVVIDNDHGAFIATEHLIDMGNRNIAFIGGPEDMEITLKRKQGFERALNQYKIPLNMEYIAYGDYKLRGGFDCMQKLHEAHPEITGVVVANDLMAIGAQHYLSGAGVSVPEEIALIGFDNIEMSESIRPSLSTVDYPIERMSERIMDLLLLQIKSPEAQGEMVRLYPTLIKRESTNCRRTKSETGRGD